MVPVPAIGQRALIDEDWRAIRYFGQAEVTSACEDGAWSQVDAGSLYLLDQFAGYLVNGQRLITSIAFLPTLNRLGQPTAIWNSPDSNSHEPNSMHYRGRAFDVMFPKNALAAAWFTAMRFAKFGGVGAYPFWKPDPGLHLDTRLTGAEEQGRGFKVCWWRKADGSYSYLNSERDVLEFLAALRQAT